MAGFRRAQAAVQHPAAGAGGVTTAAGITSRSLVASRTANGASTAPAIEVEQQGRQGLLRAGAWLSLGWAPSEAGQQACETGPDCIPAPARGQLHSEWLATNMEDSTNDHSRESLTRYRVLCSRVGVKSGSTVSIGVIRGGLRTRPYLIAEQARRVCSPVNQNVLQAAFRRLARMVQVSESFEITRL